MYGSTLAYLVTLNGIRRDRGRRETEKCMAAHLELLSKSFHLEHQFCRKVRSCWRLVVDDCGHTSSVNFVSFASMKGVEYMVLLGML